MAGNIWGEFNFVSLQMHPRAQKFIMKFLHDLSTITVKNAEIKSVKLS